MKQILIVLCMLASVTEAGWEKELSRQLPLLGHRNWIVVADSAYPLQIAPGIETIYAGGDHLAVLQDVLAAVAACPHLKPDVFMDAELEAVPEKHAAGVGDYRNGLKTYLPMDKIHCLPHEEILSKLSEDGSKYKIVIIKTDMMIPYSSVFIRLDCGYWNDSAEKDLRRRIQ